MPSHVSKGLAHALAASRSALGATTGEAGGSQTLELPFPPAVNNLFATVKTPKGTQRRIPSRRYNEWTSLADIAMHCQSWAPVAGRVRVRLLLAPPDSRQRDADNYFKAPIDFLVKRGVLRGDSREFIRGVSAEWADSEPAKPGHILITLVAA